MNVALTMTGSASPEEVGSWLRDCLRGIGMEVTHCEITCDDQSVVRPALPAQPPAKAARRKRTTEELRQALGEDRLKWWTAFWRVYPCHEGMKPAMDAFERRVRDRETAIDVFKGAVRYAKQIAAQVAAGETPKVKYAQGWINDERWKDEDALLPLGGPVQPPRRRRETSAEEARRMMAEGGNGALQRT